MPRLYKRTAKQDIWKKGFRAPANNKQGYTVDRSIPASTGDNESPDKLLIPKGSVYFTWHPKGADWQYSLTQPDLRSDWEIEITDFTAEVESIKEQEQDYDEDGEWESERDSLKERIEERRDELQTNLDAMPQALQESSVLNERIEALDELIEQLN